jgi:tetratricopeptide (TPR) repeat protein
LDGLPLALSSAGTYLHNVAVTFADYLSMYRDSWLRLQQTTPQLLSYENRTLYSTWDISYKQVERQNVNSAMLLRLWGYFDSQDLWFELLQECHSTAGLIWLRRITDDALSFNEAVRVLCDYGLVQPDMSLRERSTESRGYAMHRCVYMWTVHVLNDSRDIMMAQVAMRCVAAHVPMKMERDYWVVQRRLLRHAGHCLAMQTTGDISIAEGDEWVLQSFGSLYADQGRLDDAEAMFEWALKGYEKTLGPDHTSTLDSVHYLGILYKDKGRRDDAEAMYDRALKGYEKALGPDHASTLRAAENLRSFYAEKGRLDDAAAIYEQTRHHS